MIFLQAGVSRVRNINQKYIISMVSKNQIKLITALRQKKFRREYNLFFAEGYKVIRELLESEFVLHHLYESESLFNDVSPHQRTFVTDSELQKLSALTSANNCLAVFEIPKPKPTADSGLIVALDDIRDPGNLGTIMRLCDWFGVEQLVCSLSTVDIYNPKVIQATMGSISRIQVAYTDLTDYIRKSALPVFGTFLDGENIYQQKLPSEAIIVLGNEANGISREVTDSILNKLTIPRFGKLQQTESLNVATATAILLSEFRR